MLAIDEKPPAFASRAVGILEGRIVLDPINGEKAVTIVTPDGAEIPGVVHEKAAQAIVGNPLLLAVPIRTLVYPRTVKSRLKAIIIDLEEAGDDRSKQNDFFLVQGFNIGSRVPEMSQLAIRPNKRSKHQFEKFWLSMYGHLTNNERCVYRVKALRKGRKLFIVESDPILPTCQPKRNVFH